MLDDIAFSEFLNIKRLPTNSKISHLSISMKFGIYIDLDYLSENLDRVGGLIDLYYNGKNVNKNFNEKITKNNWNKSINNMLIVLCHDTNDKKARVTLNQDGCITMCGCETSNDVDFFIKQLMNKISSVDLYKHYEGSIQFDYLRVNSICIYINVNNVDVSEIFKAATGKNDLRHSELCDCVMFFSNKDSSMELDSRFLKISTAGDVEKCVKSYRFAMNIINSEFFDIFEDDTVILKL